MEIYRMLLYVYLQVTQLDLHRHFHSLGAGVIEEVRVQRDKGFGFVRYSTHAEAALAIQMGNTTQSSYLFGKQMKVWIYASFKQFMQLWQKNAKICWNSLVRKITSSLHVYIFLGMMRCVVLYVTRR